MYVIFNGKDSRELGIDLEVTGWTRPVLPESRDELIFIEKKHGSRLNKKPLGNRAITIHFRAYFSEDEKLETVERLAAWLYTEDFEKLVLSDEPNVYYMAKVLESIDLTPELFRAEFSITFVCQPLKYGEEKSETFENQNSGVIEVDGTYESPPIIKVVVAQTTNFFEFKLNDVAITYESNEEPIEAGDTVEINVQNLEFRINNKLKVLEVDGYFNFLQNGENTFSVNVNVESVTIEWQELYLFKL